MASRKSRNNPLVFEINIPGQPGPIRVEPQVARIGTMPGVGFLRMDGLRLTLADGSVRQLTFHPYPPSVSDGQNRPLEHPIEALQLALDVMDTSRFMEFRLDLQRQRGLMFHPDSDGAALAEGIGRHINDLELGKRLRLDPPSFPRFGPS